MSEDCYCSGCMRKTYRQSVVLASPFHTLKQLMYQCALVADVRRTSLEDATHFPPTAWNRGSTFPSKTRCFSTMRRSTLYMALKLSPTLRTG